MSRDGYTAAMVYNDKQWAAFTGAVAPQWASDRYATLEQWSREIATVYGLLAQTFAQRTTRDWLDLLWSLDIPAAPVNSLDDLFGNPHLNAVGFFETVDSPTGPVRFPGVPVGFSLTPGRVAGPAPRLGEHTEQVLDRPQPAT
jgi:crotonobetainyl-CoA:carnitine CoA-transferase CaiB-like acyl-CoA transferase